nr:sphingomyelin phosphodiesterase 4-like isoform X1 [Penaeus vannamei]
MLIFKDIWQLCSWKRAGVQGGMWEVPYFSYHWIRRMSSGIIKNPRMVTGMQILQDLTASLEVRLQNALSEPQLHIRCEEVGRILNESTSKDASFVLRTVVESVFGVNGQMGWGLRTITHSAMSREFDQLRLFLGPSGPLLSLTYRLANDPFLMFEFPVIWLPVKSRADIEEGTPGMFYVNKVQNPGPGKAPTNILLNAFEFYIFHFTHFLISGGSQRWSLSWTTAGDALYPSLLEDYLQTFLPCDSSIPPGPPSPPVSPRGVLSPVSPRSSGPGNANLYLTTLVSPIACRTVRTPGPHGYPGLEGSGAHASSPLHASHNPHPQLNIWTSQVLVQVLFEMWVNQCLPPSKSPGRSPPSSSSAPHNNQSTALHVCSVFSDHTPLEYRPNWHTNGFEVFVPSSDHVRVVRMLIKHLHFFTNSAKSAQPSPLDDLRKNVWTMYRKSLFQFLHHTFNHWPLDSSFRLVLETWLSYIQPWRYTDYSPISRSPTQTAADTDTQRMVEGKWQGFIAENLLFYTLLFYHLICRLFRLDLSAPKNAHILFRVTKVFSQANLGSYIREIEEALEDPHFMHRSLLGTPHTLSAHGAFSSLQGDQFPARSLASVARAHLLEMEGPSHSYNPMFSPGNLAVVDSLIKYIRRAHNAVVSEQQQNIVSGSDGADSKTPRGGWWSNITCLFESTSPAEGDTTVEDIRKTIMHLETAQRQLCGVFNLLLPLEFGQSVNGIGTGLSSSNLDGSYLSNQCGDLNGPQQVNTPNGPVLTNYGRYQLMSGLQRRDIRYEGDPDLKPICTYEVPLLVRWLYSLALLVNAKYGSVIQGLYSRRDLLGTMCKLLIKAPETVYEYHKNNAGSPHTRVTKYLPPRISFRFQASKYVLGYELIVLLMIYTFDLWGFLLKMIVTLGLLLIVPAYISYRYTVHTEGVPQEREQQQQQRENTSAIPVPEFR